MPSDYYISTDSNQLDINKIWLLLKNCFWSKNIPIEYIKRFVKFSLCFGLYQKKDNQLVGFARVISDYTTYAYICDVVIDQSFRNNGLGTYLIKYILSHKDLAGLKTWTLRTSEDARSIYSKLGFTIIDNYKTQLEINNLNIYCDSNFVNLHLNN